MGDESRQPTLKRGLVVSAIGADRPGLIRDLSTLIRERGGNIEDTRMTRLGGEFAILLLVTGSESGLREIVGAQSKLESELDLVVQVKPTQSGQLVSGAVLRFSASGFDRAGIVESVTRVLADHGVNVTSFLSRLENAPHSGTPLFVLEAEARIPSDRTREDVLVELHRLCEREGLDVTVSED